MRGFRNANRASVLAKRLADVAEEFEATAEEERERYETAIVTLHDKIASLKTTVELEKTRSKRQQEMIEALQEQLHSSQKLKKMESEERVAEFEGALKELEALRTEVMALRFQILRSSTSRLPETSFDLEPSENKNPNASPTRRKQGKTYADELLDASREGDLEMVKKLLNPDRVVVSNALESYRKTISVALCNASAGSVASRLVGGGADTANLLLTCGADPFDTDPETQWNALHHACFSGNTKVLEKLISATSHSIVKHIDDCTKEKQTALHLAAKEKHPNCVRILLRNGANAGAQDKDGRTPLDLVSLDRPEIDLELENSDGSGSDSGDTSSLPSQQERANETIKALKDPSYLFWSHSIRANRLYASEDYLGAQKEYDAAISLTTSLSDERVSRPANRATLYYNSARAYMKTGNHSEAIRRCTEAIDIRGGAYANAIAQRAASYMVLFDYQRAMKDYQLLIKLERKTHPNGDDGSPAASPSSRGGENWIDFLERAKQLATKASDHYLVLGVASDASAQEIKQAFRKQCLRWHPDKHRGAEDDMTRASIMFKAINEANEVLSDEQKRTVYDIDRISKRMDDIVRRQSEENAWTSSKKSRPSYSSAQRTSYSRQENSGFSSSSTNMPRPNSSSTGSSYFRPGFEKYQQARTEFDQQQSHSSNDQTAETPRFKRPGFTGSSDQFGSTFTRTEDEDSSIVSSSEEDEEDPEFNEEDDLEDDDSEEEIYADTFEGYSTRRNGYDRASFFFDSQGVSEHKQSF